MGSIRRTVATLLAVAAACAFATTATPQMLAMPTPTQAASVAKEAWTTREQALATLDTKRIDRIDLAGGLRSTDLGYVAATRCHCSKRLPFRRVERVAVLVPRISAKPVFFAEILAWDPRMPQQRQWHFVAIQRVGSAWRLAYSIPGNSAARTPFAGLTDSAGYTLPVPPSMDAHVSTLAQSTVEYIRATHKDNVRY